MRHACNEETNSCSVRPSCATWSTWYTNTYQWLITQLGVRSVRRWRGCNAWGTGASCCSSARSLPATARHSSSRPLPRGVVWWGSGRKDPARGHCFSMLGWCPGGPAHDQKREDRVSEPQHMHTLQLDKMPWSMNKSETWQIERGRLESHQVTQQKGSVRLWGSADRSHRPRKILGELTLEGAVGPHDATCLIVSSKNYKGHHSRCWFLVSG
jgi:hypothetical protein